MQEDLLAGKLYDMLGVDDRYDAATEQFIRNAVAAGKPFFFYYASHHTVGTHPCASVFRACVNSNLLKEVSWVS